MQDKPLPLPALREELALYPGPHLADGQPSWTLHDPTRNQFFRIDWLSFEIISRWSLGEWRAIADAVSKETTLQPDATDMEAFIRFLMDNQLVQPGSGNAVAFAERHAKMRGHWATRLLHNYLFFRIPLIRPDAILDRCKDYVAPFYSLGFAYLTLLAFALGMIEVYRNWERFSTTLIDTFSWNGLAGYGLALVGVKVLHELGHAFTAKRYGCRVPAMGVAFLVMFPMAYTDTNEVWKLASRRQRLAVAAAGVITELIIAMWATLAWCLLPEGTLKSIAFVLATVTWVATLAVNASPFMRFDGYFLLSDWLDMPNLHARAFALARWDMRERLLGLGVPPPEFFSPRRQRGLVLFAYATWIYRLVMFLGIAILVYAFFIKVVGILLFIVEIGWFLLLPIWNEIKQWPGLLNATDSNGNRATSVRRARHVGRSVMLALVLGVLFVLPWPTRQSASALLKPTDVFSIYAPAGAQIVKMPWVENSSIQAGQPLFELASPDLQLRWRRTQARLERLHWQASNADVDAEQRQNLQTLQQEEITAKSELAAIQTEIDLFSPVAPFAGSLRDLNPELKPGVWVGNRERLGVLVKGDRWHVETWLDEDAVRRIAVGDRARFMTDGLEGPILLLQVMAIDMDATRVLPSAQLATQFGGSIVARERHGQWVPERAVYRVSLGGDNNLENLAGHSWRGQVVIDGEWEAPGLAFLRSAFVLMWRELGF